MRIISRKTLRQFWEMSGHADAEQQLRAWFKQVKEADWANPAQVKEMFRSASVVGGNRIVFNIAGNKYRLVVLVNYPFRIVYVRFIGTHREYDRIDVTEV
jgi:mRNA interferase HigB